MLLRVKKKIILVYLCTLILLKDPVLLYRKPYSWHKHLHCTKIRSQNKNFFIKQFQVSLLSEFYDFTKVYKKKCLGLKCVYLLPLFS